MPMLVRALALVGLLGAAPTVAQTESPLAPVDTSSPSATLASFNSGLEGIEQKFIAYRDAPTRANFIALVQGTERIRRLFDVSEVPPAIRFKTAGEATAFLIDILNRLPVTPPQEIPGTPGHDWGTLPASWTIPGTEIRIARQKEGPRAGEYLFDTATVERLPEFHARIIGLPPVRPTQYRSWREEQIRLTGPLFPNAITRNIPEPLRQPVLDTPLWKVAFVVLASLLLAGALYAWTGLASRFRSGAAPVRNLLWQMTTPILMAVLVVVAGGFFLVEVNLSGLFAMGVTELGTVLLYLAGAWAAWIACFLVAESIIASPRFPDDSFDAHLLRLTARVGSPIAAGAVLVYGANTVGVPALGLVAGLGVGGIALALAAQSTIENLIGGLTIFADRPFRVGDTIQFTGGSGRVEAIGPRSTRIRRLDGAMTTVPNGDLAKMHITNPSRRTRCLFKQKFGLPPNTEADVLRRLLEALRAELAAQPLLEKTPGWPRVRLTGYSTIAIDIEVTAYVLTTSWDEFLAVQERLILRTTEIIASLGIAVGTPAAMPVSAKPG
jgi:MscS family membrane protein